MIQRWLWLMICGSVTQPNWLSMATEYYAARVTYVERLYASSAAPRMNGQPLHLAASEPER